MRLHGIRGAAPSTLAAHRKKSLKQQPQEKPAPTVPPPAPTAALDVSFPCPECALSFSAPRELARHRRFKHGVIGQVALRAMEKAKAKHNLEMTQSQTTERTPS